MRDPSPTCTRSSAHRSPGGLIISDRPSSDITRHHAGKAQACQEESSISQQPCWAAAGPAPANRNVVCLQNASIGPALACRRGGVFKAKYAAEDKTMDRLIDRLFDTGVL